MRRYLQHSVSRKLAFVVSVTLGLLSIVFIVALMAADRGGRAELADDYLRLVSRNVEGFLAVGGEGHHEAFSQFKRYVAEHRSIDVVEVLDADGVIVLSTVTGREGEIAREDIIDLIEDDPPTFAQIYREDDQREAIRTLKNSQSCQGCHEASVTTLGVVHVVTSADTAIDHVVLRFQRLLALLAVLPIVVTVIVLTLLMRRIVGEPLRELAATMRKAREGDDLVRAPVRGSDEFARLAESFNRMLSDLTALHAAQLETSRELEKVQDELEQQARLGERTRTVEEANRELEARLRELDVLYRLSRSVASRFHLDGLFSTLAEIVGGELGYTEFALLLLDHDLETLTVRATYGFSEEEKEQVHGVSFKVGQGVSGEVARTAEPILIEDTRKDNRFLHYKGKHLGDGSFLSVPLKVGDRVVGVMNFHRSALESFSKDEIRFLMAIADQIAVAIDNVMLYQRLMALSSTDELTRIPNRRAFMERIALEIARANRFDRMVALLMIDIDFFKHYNDNHGHIDGDDLLVKFARVVQTSIREVDMVARYGGEEFVVVLPNTDPEEAYTVADKIRARVASTTFRHGDTQPGGRLTISVGLAVYPLHADNPEDLLLRADFALYHAKESGRNLTVMFDDELRTALKERAQS